MKTAIHLKDKILPNPTRKTISSILKHTPACYEMSKFLIKSLRDLNRLEKVMEESKYEAIMHYPTYPENIRKIEMFNKMLT